MKKYSARFYTAIFLSILFVSCTNVKTINTPSNVEKLPLRSKTSIPIQTPTSSENPTIDFTFTPSPYPTTSEQATIEAFGSLCVNSRQILTSEISPNGKWIAAECYDENGLEISPLQVISIDRSKDWKIYYNDYATGNFIGDRHDVIIPYRWSQDGRFLYATAGSRFSGCCWIGQKYMLLIRLSLETGEQTAILSATDHSSTRPFDFILSDSDRYLIHSPLTNQPYDFAVLDLLTWKTRTVTLKYSEYIDLNYALMSPDENRVIVPLFKFYEENSEFKLDSIALINIFTNEQKLLITDLLGNEFYSVRWLDNNQVLMTNLHPYSWDRPILQETAEYWILNTNTGDFVQTEKP